jgi:hypothetical protein
VARAKKTTPGASSKPASAGSGAKKSAPDADQTSSASPDPKTTSSAKAGAAAAPVSSAAAQTAAAAVTTAKSADPAKPAASEAPAKVAEPKPAGPTAPAARPDAAAKADATAKPASGPAPDSTAPKSATPQGAPAARSDATAPKPADKMLNEPFPPAVPPTGSGGGFAAGLLGGALAVAAGIGILWVSNPDLLRGDVPPPDPALLARIDEQASSNAALAEDLAALQAEMAGQDTGDAGASAEALRTLQADLSARIEANLAALNTLSSTLTVLEGRIAQVEARPPVIGGDAGEATAQIVADMRAALAAQRAEIATLADEARTRIEGAEAAAAALQEQATNAAKSAVARAALSRLQAALDAGGPFAGALSDLTGAAGLSVPSELSAHAETGVPTLRELQRSYPEVARAALAATIRSSVSPDDGPMDRLGAFLRAQTGARSITPREGDDPDAILSRAEAALADGTLRTALGLLGTLPEAGQEALAEWRAGAEARAGAVAAAEALAATLTQN